MDAYCKTSIRNCWYPLKCHNFLMFLQGVIPLKEFFCCLNFSESLLCTILSTSSYLWKNRLFLFVYFMGLAPRRQILPTESSNVHCLLNSTLTCCSQSHNPKAEETLEQKIPLKNRSLGWKEVRSKMRKIDQNRQQKKTKKESVS